MMEYIFILASKFIDYRLKDIGMDRNSPKNKHQSLIKILFFCLMISIFFSIMLAGCAPHIKPGTDKTSSPDQLADINSADTFHDQATMAFEKGAFQSAIENWQKAEALFEKKKYKKKQVVVLVELSRAFQAIGLNSKALEALKKAFLLVKEMNNKHDKAVVFSHLGDLETIMGNHEQAGKYLNESLSISVDIKDRELTASTLNNLGNLFLLQNKYLDAANTYIKAMTISKTTNNLQLTITTLINAAKASVKGEQYEIANTLLADALDRLNYLKASHFKSFGLINCGLTYMDLESYFAKTGIELMLHCYNIFALAHDGAKTLGDDRAMSYALGYTGRLYEMKHRYDEALELTQKAAFHAQQIYAPESLYKWQWQAGRIFKQMDRVSDAVAAYRRTLFTLQSIRQEIDNCKDIQHESFRKIAGSICFEMVDLLLRKSKSVTDPDMNKTLLLEARDVVELLRVYELRNYFKDDCVDAAFSNTISLDSISKTAVVIYPVLLEDRMELLVSLPSGLKQFTLPVDRQTITRETRLFRKKLEKRTTWEFLPHAQKLFDYLIRPIVPYVSSIGVNTLVFVPSGPLRTIPIAALHDGKEFLVNTYATAVTPGLNLVDPTPIRRKNLKVLAAGVTVALQGFPPLPEVASELENIGKLFSSKLLLNQNFSIANIENELKKDEFNIVHIASHGQFQEDVDQTFVLAFDEKLTLNTLDKYAGFLQFRKSPLDLLALSACESAAGDDMAALGMAGVAVKAGARSALATLWFINDMASSLLIKEFYLQIKDPSISRAAALRQAQQRLLEDPRYDHPGYWSPFLLINNWL